MTELTALQRLSALPVANIGDSMERLGVVDAEIHPVWRGAKLAGPAFTVEVAGGDNAGIHEVIAQLSPGDVLVVNGHGVKDRALIGELIGERLRKAGCVGIVLDGALRDVDDLEEMAFPAFARSVSPAGPYRNGPFRIGVPVAIGSVVVSPGDIVVGDSDGVAVVPHAKAADIATRAEAKHADETATRTSILAGPGALSRTMVHMVETPPDASGPATVRSVDRALDLLEVLELREGPVRLVELSRGSGLGNATVLRILGSLQQRGLVTVENGEYRLGAATLGMANGYLTTDTLSNRARPVLQQLAETTRLTASLYVRVGDARVLAVRVDGENPLRYQLPLGRRLPLNVGAGKVILAALTPDEIERNLDRLGDTTTARGERVTGDDLRDQLTGIRSAGFHISIDERAIGASSVSAPVFDRRGTVTGAITASGPSETITSAELEAWTPELRRAARAVEH